MGDVLYHGTQKLASQKSTIPTPVVPFQYSLNSAVLSSKYAFRFICASILQVTCFHETLKSDINFIFRSYAPVINEDKKCTSTHTTLLTTGNPNRNTFLSALVLFLFEICERNMSRNISKFKETICGFSAIQTGSACNTLNLRTSL